MLNPRISAENTARITGFRIAVNTYNTAMYKPASEQQTCGTEEEYVGLFEIVVHFIGDAALGFGGRRELR